VYVEDAQAHEEALVDEESLRRAAEEAAMARLRIELVDAQREAGRERFIEAEPIPRDRRRAVVAWFDIATGDPLEKLSRGDTTSVRLQATAYAPANTNPVLADVVVNARATVTSTQTVPASGGATHLQITTRIDGVADRIVVIDGNTEVAGVEQLRGLELRWLAVEQPTGLRILAVSRPNDQKSRLRDQTSRLGAAFADGGTPRHVSAVAGAFAAGIDADMVRERFDGIDLGPWEPIIDSAFGFPILRLVEAELDEHADALAVGGRGHDIGEAAIDVIAGELAARNRDDGFAARARERLFGRTEGSEAEIATDAGWVMVHRRRVKECADAVTTRPVAVRRFRWFHTTKVRTPSDLRDAARGKVRVEERDGRKAAVRERRSFVGLGFEPVAVVEFEADAVDLHSSIGALRTSWSMRDRGAVMTDAVIAAAGRSEGAAVNAARLRAALAAVGDLIDVSRTEIDGPLSEIPPEFEGSDIDGVILTVGATPISATETCALVLRVGKEAAERLRVLLDRTDDPIDLSTILRGEPDPVVARFLDDELTNADEVGEWGKELAPVRPPMVLLQPTADDATPWDGVRRDILAEILGFPADTQLIERDAGSDCDAVFVIEEGR
jgi:hypothetical protein